eukprot:CAMPEP_0184496854 /NCGR_PEP_ID=MMETSP0113_2-20130426/35050_1 /TAXON_ID=91329 /ORGANISM="Norrisiella sphaerica, Strain BC52" /LENGTH=715 /DNA_ID=CAMNT_0026883685 /DNA_START=74 /DNA_END=2221 /DNA_ORIENTATION=+
MIETKRNNFFKAKEFVALYDHIFRMCIQRDPYNWSEDLYRKYSESIQNYLRERVKPALDEARNKYERAYLEQWKTRYHNHGRIVFGLSKLFMYLDRFYTPSTENVLALKKQGYKLFEDHIFKNYSQYARDAILSAINHERQNEEQDRELLKDCVSVFVDLGYNLGGQQKLRYYETQLQHDIVNDAGNFYRRCAKTWLCEDSCSAYLKKCEAALDAEKDRVNSYLHKSTMDPLIEKCYTELLKIHQSALLNKTTGMYYLLEEKQNEDLKRVFDLYVKYPADLPPIGDMFRTQVQKEGKAIVKRTNEAKSKQHDEKHVLVTSLITLHKHYDTVVKECFGNHQVFQKALKTAFESFINENDSVSKLLALYAHDVLKKGSKVNVGNVEKTLDHVVFLYGYIRDKDVFDHDYQQLLQERLLKRKCSSEANERAMIAKLKSEAGYQWTNKLEGMFKDVGVSKNLTGLFRNFFNTEQECGLVFNVNVCTHGFWPSTNYTSSKTPEALKVCTEQFEKFYHNRYAEREIQWRMDMGEAEVLVRFNPKTEVRLSVSSYQMAFLLVFNKKRVASFQEILDITGLKSDTTLQNHLLSLAHPKLGVLLKKPNSKSLARDHKFQLNANFRCRMRKITVPFYNIIRHAVNPTIDPSIAIQRRCQMDAAIVRAMKTKKRMQHMELVNEVTAQLQARFKAQPGMIKKRIEHLIEQEYLERDPAARGVYKYLA